VEGAGGGGPKARTPFFRSSKFRPSSRVRTFSEVRTLASQTKLAKALIDISKSFQKNNDILNISKFSSFEFTFHEKISISDKILTVCLLFV